MNIFSTCKSGDGGGCGA